MRRPKIFRTQNIRQASLILFMVSILSKLGGFVREAVTAREFGISAEYDLFLIIFIIPASLAITINYGITYALTPFYQKLQIQYGRKTARHFADRTFLIGFSCCLALTASAAAFADPIVLFLTINNATPDQHILAVQLLGILSWLLPLYFGIAVLQTVLQAEHVFLAPGISPFIQNIIIITILLIYGNNGVTILAYAWCAGLSCWLGWLGCIFYFTAKDGNDPENNNETVPPTARLLGAFLLSALQITAIEIWPQLYVFFDRFVAQWFKLDPGNIAALGYATTLYTMALSIFALSIGKAIFPFLSAQVARQDHQAQRKLLNTGMRWMLLVAIPVCGATFALSNLLVQVVYQRGNFDLAATTLTAAALRIYILALPLDAIYAIIIGYLYALHDYRSLIQAAFFSIIIKIAVGLALMHELAYLSLVLSTACAMVFRTCFLIVRLKKFHKESKPAPGTGLIPLVRQTLCAVAPGTILVFYALPGCARILASIISPHPAQALFLILAGCFVIFASYGIILTLLRVPEWRMVLEKLPCRPFSCTKN